MTLFEQIGVYIPLLPATVALWNWKRLDVSLHAFGIMLWLIALVSISGRLWIQFGHSNNLPFFHTYILLEALLLLVVFRNILKQSLPSKTYLALSTGFGVCWLINGFFVEGWLGYPAFIHAIEALLIIALSLLWYRKLLSEAGTYNIVQTFEFWFCSGVFIFFSSNLLLFLFSNFIVQQSKNVFTAIWQVHAIVSILLYLIYTIALIWAVKTPKSS